MSGSHTSNPIDVVAMVRNTPGCPKATTSRLLLDCLDRLIGVDEHELIIRRPRGRRPTARLNTRIIYLSVSHTSGMAAVAVSLRPVGIDIEHIRTVRSVDRVGTHIAGFMQHNDGTEQPDSHTRVLAAWTRYEATVKALGVGRALSPSEFSTSRSSELTFRSLSLPLHLTTGKLHKSSKLDHAGYLMTIAARPTSNVAINYGWNLDYTPVNYERQES